LLDNTNSVNGPMGKPLASQADLTAAPENPPAVSQLALKATEQIRAFLENREHTDFIAFHEGERYLGLAPDGHEVQIASNVEPPQQAITLGLVPDDVQQYEQMWDSRIAIARFFGQGGPALVAELITGFENPAVEVVEKSSGAAPKTPFVFPPYSEG
jgi:hypothetical protein